eukprot:scaffold1136_cov146-Cylindrotheca_fusiformis.AAC.21
MRDSHMVILLTILFLFLRRVGRGGCSFLVSCDDVSRTGVVCHQTVKLVEWIASGPENADIAFSSSSSHNKSYCER